MIALGDFFDGSDNAAVAVTVHWHDGSCISLVAASKCAGSKVSEFGSTSINTGVFVIQRITWLVAMNEYSVTIIYTAIPSAYRAVMSAIVALQNKETCGTPKRVASSLYKVS